MITDLIQIRRLGEQNRGENSRFRLYIKSHNFVERQFRKAAQDVHDEIDCRACGECCRVGEVDLMERDVEKLARFLGIEARTFVEKYTDGSLLKRTKAGCVFLDGNECTVYEARPANCERFPHVLRGAGSLQSRMWQFVDRATYCPIVFNWLEAAKKLTKFQR